MALKNLIVLTDDSSGCAARIRTALVMANEFDAYMTGVKDTRITRYWVGTGAGRRLVPFQMR